MYFLVSVDGCSYLFHVILLLLYVLTNLNILSSSIQQYMSIWLEQYRRKLNIYFLKYDIMYSAVLSGLNRMLVVMALASS